MSDIRRILDRRAAIREQIDVLNQELDLINDQLRESYDYGSHKEGDYVVSIQRNPRFNTAAFTKSFPVERYPQYYKPAVDTAALKDYFAPVDLKKWQIEGAKKVVVS
ncbi:hypothetical protein [Microbacterium sp. No. 7]|uniref:hypothetical protein n=1 Tax=Microbacterium sp. No. 7 TaxID=1714373 RepID=UPI0006CF2458|nr:hypothetical protein [Microbacterium sp. No. 7]ALJ19560.1 hypothetical protein AOA12_06405 [Microbacterium sp. No. 7]